MTKHVVTQAIVFFVIAVAAIAFAVRYIADGDPFARTYQLTIATERIQPVSPGVRVAYRGIPVGSVVEAGIGEDGRGVGIVVEIESGTQVPVGSVARTVTSTALGDTYIDIRPETAQGPYLGDGDALEMPDEIQPAPLEDLVADIDRSLDALAPESVRALGRAGADMLEGNGTRLGAFVDSTAELVDVVSDRAPTLRGLVDDGLPLVADLARRDAPVAGSAATMRDVSGQLARREATLVHLLERSPDALGRAGDLLDANRESGAGLLSNALVVTPIVTARGPAFREGLHQGRRGLDALHGTVRDGRADFTLVATQGPVCVYPGTPRRMLDDTSPREPDLSLYCPPGEDLAQRGSRTAPRPDATGLANATTPGEVAGPPMAEDPLIIPTVEEMTASWEALLRGAVPGE